MIVIVPNYVSDAINRALDKAIGQTGYSVNDNDVDYFYHQLLNHFDKTGEIADFIITERIGS